MSEGRTRTERFDVIVAGGGSAGVAAAVGAAKTGAKVLLVEAYGFLGGAATLSQVLAWCGFYPQKEGATPEAVVGGVGRLALDHLADLGLDVQPYFSSSGNWPIRLNPEATKIALDRTIGATDVVAALHTCVSAVAVSGGRLQALVLNDTRGVREVSADAYVDATGDAELAFLAGASACPLHPTGARVQPASYPVRISGVRADASLDKTLRGDAVATMNRRYGRAELRADGGLVTSLPGTGDLWWLGIEIETNGLDGTDLALAERDGRELAWRAVQTLRQHIPGFEAANVASTGPKIGIRETRHAATVAPLLEQVLKDGVRQPDCLALGAWPMEIHHGPGNTEYRRIGGSGVYGIPLGALQSRDFDNLFLAGRTLGADPAAYASARVMGTAFATGHAAGIAAALASHDPGAIKLELLRQGAVL
jgi:hypothetical protein